MSVVKNEVPEEFMTGRVEEESFEEIKTPALDFRPHNFEPKMEMTYPNIVISQEAIDDMYLMVDECDIEIGWLGLVERKGSTFTIEKVFLVKQECSSTVTKLDIDAQAKLAQELLAKKDGVKLYNKLRFWGHSHVEMDTDPSRQDDDQMEDFRANKCEYFIRGILNKNGKISFDVFYYSLGVTVFDVPWSIQYEIDTSKRAQMRKAIARCVSEHSYTTFPSSTSSSKSSAADSGHWERVGPGRQRWVRHGRHDGLSSFAKKIMGRDQEILDDESEFEQREVEVVRSGSKSNFDEDEYPEDKEIKKKRK